MALYQSSTATSVKAFATADAAGDVVVNDFIYELTATPLAVNDIIELGVLPANHTVVDIILISDDLDTNGSPTIAFDVGLMSGIFGDNNPARTCGNEFFAADQSARTGVISRMSKLTGFQTVKTTSDRSIGVKITTAAATQAAAGARIRALVTITG